MSQDKKYVFLDRDGVINRDGEGLTDNGYVTDWRDLEFLPGVLEALKMFNDAGYMCIIISNQRCVGRGLITRAGLDDLTEKMKKTVRDNGGYIHKAYYCTHLSEENCMCRKPREGLFTIASKELFIDTLNDSYYIGDSERDVVAGKKAGLKTILVFSGKTSPGDQENWEIVPDHTAAGLLEAAKIVLEENEGK